jgi:hypothetical protein
LSHWASPCFDSSVVQKTRVRDLGHLVSDTKL